MAIVGRLLRAEARAAMSNCDHLTEEFLAAEWARKVGDHERQWERYAEVLGSAEAVAKLRGEVARDNAARVAGRIASGVYCRRCGGLHDANPSRYQIEERAAKASSRRAR